MSDPPRTKILNVEDYAVSREATSDLLRAAGYVVVEASNGTEALQLIHSENPQLVLLDVNLPGLSGYEICQQLKADLATKALPVLLISGSLVEGRDKAHGLENGADGYLIKPVDPVELMAHIKALLRMREAESEREQLLVREREARAQAEAATHAKDEFLALVSHELRTPLNAMLGWTRVLQSRPSGTQPDVETLDHALEVIGRNAHSQLQLIEDLLDVSRIVTGKLRIESRPLALAPLVQATFESLRPMAEAKGIQLQSVEGGMQHHEKPGQETESSAIRHPSSAIIMGDPDRLQQAIWNLLTNAIKFTPSGGKILISTEQRESEVLITVSDNGQGISAEFLPLVYERFRQADSARTNRTGGLGLGLTLVRTLVESHGGSVRAESAGVGQGATFSISLPLAQRIESESKNEIMTTYTNTADLPLVDAQLNGVRVLVVDDEEIARELVAMILAQSGAATLMAGSVAMAMATLAALPPEQYPDVIISDLSMPDEDGYSLIRQLRQLSPERGGRLPVVALTAFGRVEDRVRVLGAGFQTHITKPVEAEELVTVIASLVTRQNGRISTL
jgi:signal transduction histidine kinase